MKTKLLAFTILFLITTIFYLAHKIIDQAITIDHLQMSVTSAYKREKCLIALSNSFVSDYNNNDLKSWIKNNLSHMDIYDEGEKWIVNEVGFDFSKSFPTIE